MQCAISRMGSSSQGLCEWRAHRSERKPEKAIPMAQKRRQMQLEEKIEAFCPAHENRRYRRMITIPRPPLRQSVKRQPVLLLTHSDESQAARPPPLDDFSTLSLNVKSHIALLRCGSVCRQSAGCRGMIPLPGFGAEPQSLMPQHFPRAERPKGARTAAFSRFRGFSTV